MLLDRPKMTQCLLRQTPRIPGCLLSGQRPLGVAIQVLIRVEIRTADGTLVRKRSSHLIETAIEGGGDSI
jgi:hypothetical protein